MSTVVSPAAEPLARRFSQLGDAYEQVSLRHQDPRDRAHYHGRAKAWTDNAEFVLDLVEKAGKDLDKLRRGAITFNLGLADALLAAAEADEELEPENVLGRDTLRGKAIGHAKIAEILENEWILRVLDGMLADAQRAATARGRKARKLYG